MKNTKDFINRVVKKMGYSPSEFIEVEGDVYEDVLNDTHEGLNEGMVFLIDTCIKDSAANQIAKEYNESEYYQVITFEKDKDNSVSIIVSCADGHETVDGVNIQPLGIINAFLNQLTKIGVVIEDTVVDGIQEPNKKSVEALTEHISLKDYYRLNLPDNKIGRKSDDRLIKELEEAGFKVE